MAASTTKKSREDKFFHGILLTKPVTMLEKGQKVKMYGKWHLVDEYDFSREEVRTEWVHTCTQFLP